MARRGKGEGSVHRRSDGRWVGVASLGYRNGRRDRKYVYGRTRAEAARKLGSVLSAAQSGLPVPSDRQSVGNFLTRWLRDVIEPSDRKLSTKASYADNVRLHLLPTLGSVRLTALAPQHVSDFVQAKRNDGYSDRTIQYNCAILRSALNQAVVWGDVQRNVAALVRVDRLQPKEEPDALTADEVRRLLTVAGTSRYFSLFLVMATLGLRKGETLALRWSDTDLDVGTMMISRTVQRIPRRGLVFSAPKTSSSRRVLELPTQVVDALREHRLRQMQERLAAGPRWEDHDLVFPSSVGTPIEPRNLNRHFNALCAKAGLASRRVHSLRHGAASIAYGLGLDTKMVQELLGHSRYQTTADTYTHVQRGSHREASQMIADAVLGGTPGSLP